MHALRSAADRVRSYHERQLAQSWSYTEADGTRARPESDAAGSRRHLRAGRQGRLSIVGVDECDSRQGGRRARSRSWSCRRPDGVKNDWCWRRRRLPASTASFTIGGAQAVGALAYGTPRIPQVDKIVGPGNAYVAAAKRRVFGMVGIDMIAGPSEILVICDGTTDPDWVAMDLFSQAEHDELAQSILLCPDAAYIDAGRSQHQKPARRDAAAGSDPRLADRSRRVDQGARHGRSLRNRQSIAAEHLEISAANPQQMGGPQSAMPARCSSGVFRRRRWATTAPGPNHVLPTSRTARFSSPLGVYDFQKRSSLIAVSKKGAVNLGAIAVELARGEGLDAHAAAAAYRMK